MCVWSGGVMAGLRLIVLMVAAAWMCVKANDVYITHLMAFGSTSPEYIELEATLKSLTNATEPGKYLHNKLRISTCPKWQCSDGLEPRKFSSECFNYRMYVTCHREPQHACLRDTCPENMCILGYLHRESCDCAQSGGKHNNITWTFLNNTMEICHNEPIPSYNEAKELPDNIVDVVTIHIPMCKKKIPIQVCRPRECDQNHKTFNFPTDTLKREHIGGVTLLWQDEKCECKRGDQNFDRNVESFTVLVQSSGHEKNVTLKEVRELLMKEIRCPEDGRETTGTQQTEVQERKEDDVKTGDTLNTGQSETPTNETQTPTYTNQTNRAATKKVEDETKTTQDERINTDRGETTTNESQDEKIKGETDLVGTFFSTPELSSSSALKIPLTLIAVVTTITAVVVRMNAPCLIIFSSVT
ncbi:uncharacterized protein LOC135095627 isoform X1 [Scylla paramamosain]|uniref:uncharacterized protein LOC135095627 isoform X1 n=2 Tax=Scylla paramamosain TaxID=85552 RepID=UPI003083D11B